MGAQADVEAIDRVRATHVAALNADDVESWLGVFAEDGIQMPPNTRANVGKAAIRPWVDGFLGTSRCEFDLDVQEVRVAGDWAFERGGYRIVLTPKAGGAPMHDMGKYITIYQRQADGAWEDGARHVEQRSAVVRLMSLDLVRAGSGGGKSRAVVPRL